MNVDDHVVCLCVFCGETCAIELFLLDCFYLKKYESGCNCIK